VLIGERPEWHEQANCRGVGKTPGGDGRLFFPNRGESAGIAGVVYCSTCPVAEICLDHGLRHEHSGIWGGTSERQRRVIRKERGITVTTTLATPIHPEPTT
jgi:WhiB family redox-sensing transcriptional regulator